MAPAWRNFKNIFFTICTWPNRPVAAKILSGFQFEGKSDVWTSQVRRVNSFSNHDCILHYISYNNFRGQYYFKVQKNCIFTNTVYSQLFESFIWNFEFMFSHFVSKEATMVFGRIRFKSEESVMDCKKSYFRYALLSL